MMSTIPLSRYRDKVHAPLETNCHFLLTHLVIYSECKITLVMVKTCHVVTQEAKM